MSSTRGQEAFKAAVTSLGIQEKRALGNLKAIFSQCLEKSKKKESSKSPSGC
jgi:hypothetical protein